MAAPGAPRRDPRAAFDLLLAAGLTVAGFGGYLGPVPTLALLAAAVASFWWRGPGWRAAGLRRPASWPRALAAGIAVGVGFQVLSLYVLEPAVAFLTTGALPDVSVFRPLVGQPVQLAFWITMSWTLAAFVEEMVFRGWLLTRAAELASPSPAAWVVALVVSSAFFGAAHLYQGWSGILTTGLNGAVFAGAYLLSGRNLWVPIIAHGMADTLGFTMIYLGVYPGI
ncbi:MAG: CPBP family intramembrane glutamic endopeptidase [Vicinamibacterales bacterium]